MKLSNLELNLVCQPCRDKLKSYYDYHTFVLKNQKLYEKMLRDSKLENLKDKVEFVEIRKDEKSDHMIESEPEQFVGRLYKCFDCNIEFNSRKEYRSHWKKKHQICEICNKDSIKKEPYIHHMQRHYLSSDPKKLAPYICHHCGKKLNSYPGIRSHLNNFHLNKFVCEVCGYKCGSQGILTSHIKNVHETGPLAKTPCPICGMMIKARKSSMEAHIRNRHQVSEKVTCPICQVPAKHNAALRKHIDRAHKEKRFVCSTCNKRFYNRLKLTEHEAIHYKKSLYFCEFCNAEFKSGGNFVAHKRRLHPIEYQQQKIAKHAKKFEWNKNEKN